MFNIMIQLIFVFGALLVSSFFLNLVDYRFMKSRHLKNGNYDLNICCGDTSCGGVNADIVKRNVPRFVLIKNIYKLPFRDKQFKNAVCSHTMEHVKNHKKFFKELKRVSRSVTILVPPLWDFGCMFNIHEHKRQFLTLRTRHVNGLPRSFSLPLADFVQNRFGQKM